jgi:hypothetical protein
MEAVINGLGVNEQFQLRWATKNTHACPFRAISTSWLLLTKFGAVQFYYVTIKSVYL